MKRRKNRFSIVLLTLSFIALVSVLCFFYFKSNTAISTENESIVLQSVIATYKNVSINVPAVDNEGKGAIVKLKVQATPGEGRTLVNVDNLLFWVDTQFSIRTAKSVAENVTGLDLSKVDLIYTIETEASVIEGQSAGAALTIATVAAIENKTINKDVIITGTIMPDGKIGPIGSVFEKAKAAKDMNATLFLVPEGQGTQINYMPEKKCEKIGPITYCTTEYKQGRIDISKDAGIDVKEVSDINEALKYFLT
jgi:uncharacterized protein